MNTTGIRQVRNENAHGNTHIAYSNAGLVDWHCTDPRCKGWDDCTAVFNPRAGTLAVTCTLCKHQTVARLL